MEYEPDDQPIERTPASGFGRPSDGPPLLPIAVAGVAIVALLAGGAWWLRGTPTPANVSPAPVTATDAPITEPTAPAVVLPPLDEMDGFLRPLLQALSNRPELVRWLATDDLVRQLAAAIDQASQGDNPAGGFKELWPSSRMTVTQGRNRSIDPASYRRYSGLVTTITSIDASAVARIYKTIRPRLNEAYQNMGNPGGNVDTALRHALDLLLGTPVTKDPVLLVEGAGARWAYADPNLERLAPTQKQLVRMGPVHTDAMLVWLRALRSGLD